MIVRFEDRAGETGEVTEELDVEYDGGWEAEVRECVDEVETDFRTDGDVATEAALGELVVELPAESAVVRVERRHE